MNKKLVLSLLTVLTLSACTSSSNNPVTTTTSGTNTGTTGTTTGSDTGPEVETKTNEDFEYAKTTFMKNGVEVPLNMQTIYTNQNAPHYDPLGEGHVMVVPFGFTDENLQSVQTEENIERIRKTFFGTDEEMREVGGWKSMAQFYRDSSYGKSNFQGAVIPTWVNPGKTSAAFGASGINSAEYARTWYLEEYAKENHGALGADAKPFSWFDCNNDGFLDLVWIVYSHPTGSVNDWWAYVTYTGNSSNKTKPTVKTLGFASIDWMDKAFGGYDPHTFIHETGHTYGLDDYYDYTNSWAPMGGIDFMDHNLGDHCMFSKFSLGWTSPLVVDDSAVITLRPGTTTGDCFILPSPGYNGTAFDEYMMVELMAPVGLAEQDYKNGYQSTNGYSKPGIRITHVDARVYDSVTTHDGYLTDEPQKGLDFRLCNTKGGRMGLKSDGDYWMHTNGEKKYMNLIGLMESAIDPDNNCLTTNSYTASNNTLFTKGERFNLKPGVGGWADTFMPSKTNLWNKAKTTTGWTNSSTQTFEIDENCTFDYSLKVVDIVEDAQYGYTAKVQVTKTSK